MKILITGGSGFIGSHLTRALKKKGAEVIIADICKPKEAIEGVAYEHIDVRKKEDLLKLKKYKIDAVYHLAAQTSAYISAQNPVLDMETNINGTLNTVEYIRENKIPKIIFTSSMAVYKGEENALNELSAVEPRSCYGISKLTAEQYIKNRAVSGDYSYSIFRLFNVYGPGQNYNNLLQGMVSIYIAQAVRTKQIKITGSADRFRDFIHVSDVVSGLLLPLAKQEVMGQTINIGTGKKTTVRQLILEIEKIANEKIKFENIGGFSEDQVGTYCDNKKIISFGWSANTNLENGLRDTFIRAREELK